MNSLWRTTKRVLAKGEKETDENDQQDEEQDNR